MNENGHVARLLWLLKIAREHNMGYQALSGAEIIECLNGLHALLAPTAPAGYSSFLCNCDTCRSHRKPAELEQGKVDLVEKWRKRAKTIAVVGVANDSPYTLGKDELGRCASELESAQAAQHQVSEEQVREKALEEAAQMVEREWFTSLFDKNAVAKAIRALAAKVTPEGGSDVHR